MIFSSSSTEIRVIERFNDDFNRYMAIKVPEIQRWLTDKRHVTAFAVECAIRDHSEWFEFSFYKFGRTPKYYGQNPEFYIQERVSNGFALMEASA